MEENNTQELELNPFEMTILAYLRERADKSDLFKRSFLNPNKNIKDCCTYIFNCVQKSNGRKGFTDDEVYNMAVHYYDEESIDIGKPIAADVYVNHVPELSDEEIASARQKAFDELVAEEKKKMKSKKKTVSNEDNTVQGQLF